MITPSSETTIITTVSTSCIMNTAAADHNNSENRFSIANCAIESNNRTTTTNKRVATHQCTNVDRQPLLPSQQRTVRYMNHEHHITDQHMTSSLSIQTMNSNKAEVQIRKEEDEEEEENFDKHNLLIGRRLHRIKRRLFLQLTVPSIPPALSTSNSLFSSSASSCCSTTSLVLTVE
ncbi:hypothetical protein FRACYDRAFT_252641 [Fragilariopsis cylindrus CCMP1102]|uniref:Uncharacterized protein n=1 Tax=Fragilariopsis cylindrus CCMP1102 TaxID=635003 RepID=A0A1E7EM53_9STRA|nr:hypothetical protein FRACYDRAFT_252641 [Fragilariopsis cylindrus CCMP1102]|eukprot:OEU07008.1 hypothetical protein FRACYDRAFT_252641 [Fragilariopsis cylindrus CCMP1102]